jgi:hypothetical protein
VFFKKDTTMWLQSVIEDFILGSEGRHANTRSSFFILWENQCYFYSSQVSVCGSSNKNQVCAILLDIEKTNFKALQDPTQASSPTHANNKIGAKITSYTTTTTRQPLRDNHPPRPNHRRVSAPIKLRAGNIRSSSRSRQDRANFDYPVTLPCTQRQASRVAKLATAARPNHCHCRAGSYVPWKLAFS